MDVLALRSPGLPGGEIQRVAAEVGITVTVVTSLEEGEQRGLPLDTVIVDGMGETAEILTALSERLGRIQRVVWLGFEAPAIELPGLVVVSPLEVEDRLAQALIGSAAMPAPAAVQATMVPISLVPSEPLEPLNVGWDLEVQQPRSPIDRPPPAMAPIDVQLVGMDEGGVASAMDPDPVLRPRGAWRAWRRPVLGVALVGGLLVYGVGWQLASGPEVSLPEPASQLPVYPKQARAKRKAAAAPAAPAQPAEVPKPMKVLAKSQPAPLEKRAAGTVVVFDQNRLKGCLDRLGKKGRALLRRRGVVRVAMRLGVMADGKIAAASTTSVRFGKKRYKSLRFNACAEGQVVGQQLGIRPKNEPTFVRRTFTLRR